MSMVGTIAYPASMTRLDIKYAAQVLPRLLQSSGDEHRAAAKRVGRYLQGTSDCGINYSMAGVNHINMDGGNRIKLVRYSISR